MQRKTNYILSIEDSNCTDESQSFTMKRNGVLSHLDPNNKSRLSKRDFVDDGVSPKNKLRRYGRVSTRRRIYDARSGICKPVKTAHYIIFK